MSYRMNDLVEVIIDGRRGIAVSDQFFRTVYSQHDREMMSRMQDYKGGWLEPVVTVLFPDTGIESTFWVGKVKKISE